MKSDAKTNSGVEILIAEDSPTQAAQLAHLLEQHGYAVTIAVNGREALAQLDRHLPTLVISDVLMPELDGYGLSKAIRADPRWKDLPVMLVTTLSDPLDVIRGLECGADNFIRKPYDETYVVARIRYLLMNLELRKNQKMQMGVEISLGGQRHFITSERQQILDLLISTYEQAVNINDELKSRQKELAHSNQVLEALFRMAGSLNQAIGVNALGAVALDSALELPGIRAGWISLRDGDGGFRLIAARNMPPALGTPGAMDSDCACCRRVLSGEFAVAGVLECEHLQNAIGDRRGLLHHASVPLMLGDRTVGVMNLVGPRDSLFAEKELHLLDSVGNHVAIALERARLREDLESLVSERTAHMEAEIVKRKDTEQRLRESEERYRLMFDQNPHPTWVYDAETLAFLAVNNAAIRHYGYSEDEFRRMTIKDIRPAEGIPALLHSLTEHPDTPLPRVFGVFKHRKKDGTVIDVEIASSAITFSGRTATLVLANDVTEKRRNQEESNRLQAQIEQSQRVESLGRVAATIAHEFNNVLMGIQPFAEVIQRNTSADAKIKKAAGQIIHSVARGKRVTEDILRFTRAAEPVLQPVDLCDWIERLVPELRGMIGDRIEISVDFPKRPVIARCDPAQLQQVVANLAVNARDAIPGQGTIFIAIAPAREDTRSRSGTFPPGMVLLSVRDTGSGMPREILDHIFEPLFTTKRTGTGLGLAVAQQVIARHGGLIHVESEPGKGTTVSMLLPAAAFDNAEAAPPALMRPLARVLLVEDDREVAAGIVALLESDGIEVRSVACGLDAAPAVRSFEPDAILVDVTLPDMSGVDVFAELRMSWPKLPVVFSTGHGDQAAIDRLTGSPTVGLLRKPYDRDALLRALESVIAAGRKDTNDG